MVLMNDNGFVRYPDELCHYGVPGMKWGVRRYQNADGSFNSAGKKRYGFGDGKTYNGVKGGKTTKKKKILTDDRKTRFKKASKVISKEVVKPAVKTAAVTAGLSAAGTAAVIAANSAKGKKAIAKVASKIGQNRAAKIAQYARGGSNIARTVAGMPVTRMVVGAAGAVATGRTIYKVHKGFEREGVYKKKRKSK